MRLGLIAVKDVGLYAILTRLGIVVSTSRLCAHRRTWDANERDTTEAVAGHLAANDESETATETLDEEAARLCLCPGSEPSPLATGKLICGDGEQLVSIVGSL